MGQTALHGRLALALATLVLGGCKGDRVPATPSVGPTGTPTVSDGTTTAVPTTATAPSAAPTTPITGWRPAPDQPSVHDRQFTDVAWTGSTFIAIADGRLLDSTDGLTWHLQDAEPVFRAGAISAGPQRVLVLTAIGDAAASRLSADGLAWTSTPAPFPVPAAGTDDIPINDVVATDAGWLAVGSRVAECDINCGMEAIRAYVWTSPDGSDWTRVADQAALEGGGMNSVARVPGAGYVAAGI